MIFFSKAQPKSGAHYALKASIMISKQASADQMRAMMSIV